MATGHQKTTTPPPPKGLNRLQRHSRYWNALLKADPGQRTQLVRYATPDQVDAVSEMAYNVLKGTPSLPKSAVRRLHPFKRALRGMGDPRKSWKSRRHCMVQGGGSAVGALVKGLAQGLKEGARQGFQDQKPNVVRGLKEGAHRTLPHKVKTMFSRPSPDEKDREAKIQQLEQEIQSMEEALKST